MRHCARRTVFLGAGLFVASCVLAGAAVGGESAPGAGSPLARGVERLAAVRDALQDRLAQRMKADAAIEPPRDFRVVLEGAIPRESLTLVLHRRGGKWLAPQIGGLSPHFSDRAVVCDLDVSALRFTDGKLTGTVTVVWGMRIAAWEDRHGWTLESILQPRVRAPALGGSMNWSLGGRERLAETSTLTYTLDARRVPTDRRLHLTLRRAMQEQDIHLVFRPTETGWTLEESTLSSRSKRGDYVLKVSDLTRSDDGTVEGTVEITRRIANPDQASDKQKKHVEQYNARKPVYALCGTIRNGYLEGAFDAVGAYGMFRDRLSGIVRDHALEGRYEATGPHGYLRGRVGGTVTAAPAHLAMAGAATDKPEPSGAADGPAALTVRAARLYRQIGALHLAAREYPLRLDEALERVTVAEPVWPTEKSKPVPGAVLEAMQRYVEGLGALGAMAQDETASGWPAVEGVPDLADPDFGPYFPSAPLQSEPGKPNRLPEPIGADGPQRWQHPVGWRFTGPYPAVEQTEAPFLPQVLPIQGIAYRRSRLLLGDEGEEPGHKQDVATWMPVEPDRPVVTAPEKPETAAGKMQSFAWYAATEIHSPKDQTVWLGVQAEDRGSLWINGSLVWASGPGYESIRTAVFRAPLRQGVNRVLVRCANAFKGANRHLDHIEWFEGWGTPHPRGAIDYTSFRLLVCTEGRPGTPEQVRARRAAERKAAARPPDGPVGYRGDGTGRYPEADPPLAWDIEKGVNVLWQAPLPAGAADPVLAGDRLLVSGEPHTLLCLNKDTGEVLWKRAANFLELAGHEKWRQQPNILEDYMEARRRMRSWQREQKATRDRAQQETLQEKIEQARDRWAAFEKHLTDTGMRQFDNLASATPVVAGDRVWVSYGTGVAACYDLSGTRKWMVRTGPAWSDPAMGSPLLVGDRLILQTRVTEGRRAVYGLLALDADTGEVLWRKERPGGFGPGIAHAPLANPEARFDVIVTAGGDVVRADTGQILHEDIARLEANRAAPYIFRNVAYFTPLLGQTAARLWLQGRDAVGCRPLWRLRRTAGRGQAKTVTSYGSKHWFKGPLVHEGQVYVMRTDTAHVPGHYTCPSSQLDAYDVETGHNVAQIRPMLTEALDPVVPPVLAGDHLFLVDAGDPIAGFGGCTDYGKVAVVEPGPSPWVVARSKIPKMRAGPVFEGQRMYLRTGNSAICIAATTEAGKRYQEEVLAGTLLREIQKSPPAVRVAEPAPLKALPPADPKSGPVPGKVPIVRLASGKMPDRWLALGPLPIQKGADPLASLGGEAQARPEAGTEVTCGTATLQFQPLDAKFVLTLAGVGRGIDVFGAVGRKANSLSYYYTVLENARPGTFKYQMLGVGKAAAWLGGREIRPDDVVRLSAGAYPLLVRVDLSGIPPFVNQVVVRPTLRQIADPEDEYARWVRRVRRHKARLERVIERLPESEYARRAQAHLARLEKE